MNVICNDVLYANQFVEYATGNYYFHCDTLSEMCSCYWSGTKHPVSKIWDLKDINKVPKEAYVCFVQTSKENDFTDYETKIVRVPKNLVNKFIKNMEEEEN